MMSKCKVFIQSSNWSLNNWPTFHCWIACNVQNRSWLSGAFWGLDSEPSFFGWLWSQTFGLAPVPSLQKANDNALITFFNPPLVFFSSVLQKVIWDFLLLFSRFWFIFWPMIQMLKYFRIYFAENYWTCITNVSANPNYIHKYFL